MRRPLFYTCRSSPAHQRRRILELLADGGRSAGDITAVVQREFGISQPGVPQHLRVLRENGFARVRPAGARRPYAVEAAPLEDVDRWLERFRQAWDQSHDAVPATTRSP